LVTSKAPNLFDMTDRVAVITGGGGLLGRRHAEALSGAGAVSVLIDIDIEAAKASARLVREKTGGKAIAEQADITDLQQLVSIRDRLIDLYSRIDVLVNNAANNPKVEDKSQTEFSRLENFPIDQWDADISVGLTGAFLCSRVFGAVMAEQAGGVILNIASDLAVIGPDQRLYRKDGLEPESQPVKPVTYSVVKSGLIGLTRYLATYWADNGVRVNAISPGGVQTDQSDEFISRLANLIPMGRMAVENEYQGAILFLCSDASSYMTGQNLIIDGGRTCW
jgi:NAD(P)-dependent dehydrogenase (short-subunit alcohol dehydrogenase family)